MQHYESYNYLFERYLLDEESNAYLISSLITKMEEDDVFEEYLLKRIKDEFLREDTTLIVARLLRHTCVFSSDFDAENDVADVLSEDTGIELAHFLYEYADVALEYVTANMNEMEDSVLFDLATFHPLYFLEPILTHFLMKHKWGYALELIEWFYRDTPSPHYLNHLYNVIGAPLELRSNSTRTPHD